eukprot:GHRR01026950.1.p1 GENE.GHRR01026950.1~~GHRR01026950.1.p1  ORF type:complete len:532 (+),score=180.41 GHRR01026950.1:223-1818(+)
MDNSPEADDEYALGGSDQQHGSPQQAEHGMATAAPTDINLQTLRQQPEGMHMTQLEQQHPNETAAIQPAALGEVNLRPEGFTAVLHHWLQRRFGGDARVVVEHVPELHRLLQEAAAAAPSGAEESSSYSSSSGTESEEAKEPGPGCRQFDPNVTSRHQYLGDVDDLEGSYGHLPEDTTARLPLLMLDGVVLFPGCQLPLLLSTQHEQHLLERALSAPAPLTRLLAVLPGPRSLQRIQSRLVCCTAEVRQMRHYQEDGSLALVALGRQRAEVLPKQHMAQSQASVMVRILSEGCQTDVPPPIRCHASAIHPALARPWDLKLLVGRVRELMQLVLMPVASFQGSPVELSYWVSHNLPLQPSTRQLLLAASGPADRLRLLLSLLERLDQLRCSMCNALLATTGDVLAMTAEGIGGTFVNSHGYVHDMVTFKRVRGLHYYGSPETEHSWFPGYAWTIAHCDSCGQHLGWRFTATQQGLTPKTFWGLRRPVLVCSSRSDSDRGQRGWGEHMEGDEVQGPFVIRLRQLPRVARTEGH